MDTSVTFLALSVDTVMSPPRTGRAQEGVGCMEIRCCAVW